MTTNWQELSKKLNVLKDDGSELYFGNAAEALEEILGDDWLKATLNTFIEGMPGNELAIKTLRYISSPKAAAMAFKMYKNYKDSDRQKASMAAWALSDIRTEKSMDYALEIIEQSEYEIIAISIIRNLIFDSIHQFTEEKILTVLSKVSDKYHEDVEPLFEFVQQHFHPKKWYNLLGKIEERPTLYGIQKVEDIFHLHTVFNFASDKNDNMDEDLHDFQENFTTFVVDDYNAPSHCNWCTAIRLYSTSDAGSVELFFEELAKYKSKDENFDRVAFREKYQKNK